MRVCGSRHFRDHNYSSLVVAQSQAVLTDGTIDALSFWLDTDRYHAVAPLAMGSGVVASRPRQSLASVFHLLGPDVDFVGACGNGQAVMDRLQWLYGMVPRPVAVPLGDASPPNAAPVDGAAVPVFAAPLQVGLSTRLSLGHRIKAGGGGSGGGGPVLEPLPHGDAVSACDGTAVSSVVVAVSRAVVGVEQSGGLLFEDVDAATDTLMERLEAAKWDYGWIVAVVRDAFVCASS